jgi:lipoyl(octanoyl) transferase
MSGDGTLTAAWLGPRPYREMLEEQERLVERRRTGETTDTVLLLEHPPTYTLGRRSEPTDRAGLEGTVGTEVVETPRGGRITWHGPGQLVAYPIVDLKGIGPQPEGGSRVDVAGFVASLEQAMASSLGEWGVESGPIEGLTGIWTGSDAAELDPVEVAAAVRSGGLRKIGSIGLRVSRGVTSHGISLNLNCDLSPFERVDACGIEGCRMTSVEAEVDSAPDPAEAAATFQLALARELGLEAVEFRAGPADSITSP